jgi:diamine N-acetyltransferase
VLVTEVFLRPITAANWKACINLSLDPTQAQFLPTNLYSIAEAQFYPDAHARAIYTHDDHLVGFMLYGIDVATNTWKVFRLMIDHQHQRQGYGRAAMQQVIAELFRRPACTEILISYQRTNTVARQLYTSLGFVEHTTSDDHYVALIA